MIVENVALDMILWGALVVAAVVGFHAWVYSRPSRPEDTAAE